MKKFFIIIFCFFSTFAGFSQHTEIDKSSAFELVKNTRSDLGFSEQELNNLTVVQSYSDQAIGATYVYLQQTFKGIRVHNKIIVLAYKNGKLISKAGSLFQHIQEYADLINPMPAVSAEAAVQSAARNIKAALPSSFSPRQTADGKIHFGTMGIAYEDVTAQLLWLPAEKEGSKNSLHLIWQVLLAPLNTSDMWYIRVDALNNTVLNKDNLTVYEKNNEHLFLNGGNQTGSNIINKDISVSALTGNSPSLVGTANYLVIPYPVESPLYGPAITVTNPWTMAGAINPNAVTLKWHNDGLLDYTISRGNNVWATEDRAGTNNSGTVTPTGLPATSTTFPDPLNFNFIPDYTVAPTDPIFQQYAITNLFYWNNLMHDMFYNYGFDEVSGNFQASNLGRGGTGNDYVIAIAQSANGTNNANFSSPPDGGRGRMRMYLFNANGSNPNRDGDLDNGIITHEYGHGISNRLTGGTAGGGGCLNNNEQAGEGWSDYIGLMMTTNWATAQITDGFNVKRPIGNYAMNLPVTNKGIRSRPYSTDFTVNNLTYAYVASSGGEVHSIGEVWCAALWDMTWNIIQTTGINPNLFNAAGTGGNSIALKLVTEGMRLQPCSPGFLDSRDAILKADQLLYGGLYHCAILSAFARRGMGTDAKQGSSGSTSDQTTGFSTIESALTLTQSVMQQAEGLTVTYTNKVTAGACGSLVNYLLTDTLPANVTYVSGGSYNAANRVVSFPVSLGAGASQTYSFTVLINAGSYFPTVTLFEDQVAGGTLPSAIWNISSTTATNWAVSSARSNTPPSSYYSLNTANISDQRLFSVNAIALGATPPNLTFWHWYNTESTYDGGILEISTDGGTVYNYVSQAGMISGGYTTTMDASTVLAGKLAWSGNSNGFIKTTVNLTPYANQSVKFRFTSTTDNGTALEGWYVDDIAVKKVALVDMRSSLFNASGVRVQMADTFTIILPSLTCINVGVSTQPVNVTACSGNTATFSIAASGFSPSYQWQVSTDGITYNNMPAEINPALVITNVTGSMNGYKYRVIISNTCPSAITSGSATLTVIPSGTPVITVQPADVLTCSANASFSVIATGPNLNYQWQVSIDGGITFTNIAGANSATVSLINLTPSMSGNKYRVVVSSGACGSVTSGNVTARIGVNPVAVLTEIPGSLNNVPVTVGLIVTTNPAGNYFYQWNRNNEILPVTGSSVTATNGLSLEAGTYRVTVTDVATGCSGITNSVKIDDIQEVRNVLFISPNPTRGMVHINYSTTAASQARNIIVYDSKGRRLMIKDFNVTGTYGTMDLDLSPLSKGTYIIILRDAAGKKIGSGRVVKM